MTQMPAPVRILVETYRNPGEPSSAVVRVRALQGQQVAGQDVGGYNVQCSRTLRAAWPVAQRFLMAVNLRHRQGTPFLSADPLWPWEPLP